MKILHILIVILITTMTALPVLGTSILIQQPEVVVKQAPLIVDVTVKDIKFVPISNLSTGEAWITLSVVDKIVGDCPSEIVIRRSHVTPDLRFFETEWDPPYSVGEHFIICLFPTSNGYSTMGLYNGKFTHENIVMKGTQIRIDEFKQQIREIRDGKSSSFPNELPRQTANGVSHVLKNEGRGNTELSAGSNLNGEFITWDFTWNTSYVPVQMHYNSSNAPSGAPDANGIASLASTAYSLWADPYSFLTFQNASTFTTTAVLVRDDFSVIVWLDFYDTSILAETFTYPNDLQSGVFYGPNSNTGVDFQFNPNIGSSNWYFNQTPPSSRTLSQIDFVEVLAHELGHGLGLQHVSNSNSMMYAYYLNKTCPIRGETDGDLAGRVYQHTTSPFNLTDIIPHSLVLSALSNRTVNITGNVSIPSVRTFELENQSTQIDLNSGTWIKSTGGLFLDDGGNSWTPDLRRTSGTTLLGHYTTLETAMSDAGSGQSVTASSGYFVLASNISVSAGVTLTICSGVTINLNGYSIASTGGTINVESGTTIAGATLKTGTTINGIYPTIQSAVNVASNNQTIALSGNTFNENVNISTKSNFTITGSPSYYAYINGTVGIDHCPAICLTMFSCNKIGVTNSNDANLFNDVYGSGYSQSYGIYIQACSNFQRGGGATVSNAANGILALFSQGYVLQSTKVTNNYEGVVSSMYSNIMLTGSRICGSVSYDLDASSRGGYIYASNCYYNNGIPRTIGNVLVSGVNNCSYLGKISASTVGQSSVISFNSTSSDDSVRSAFTTINNAYFDICNKIKVDTKKNGRVNRKKFYNEYAGVINDLKKIAKNNPSSFIAKVALATAAQSFWRFEDYEAMRQFLDEIIVDEKLVQLRDLAKLFIIDYYRDIQDYDNAITTADMFIKDHNADEELICKAIFEKGMILWHELNQPNKAIECFTLIARNYPNSPMIDFVKDELAILEKESKGIPKENQTVEKIGFEVINYPNPFNPTTTIAYRLPETGRVTLKVFDMLGREIATLVNEQKEAGRHIAIFDGSRSSSGIYFVRLTIQGSDARPYVKTMKMLLMK